MSSTVAPAAPTDVEADRAGRNLGMWPLVGLIVGSMIGAGIFHLPAQVAATAGTGPMLIGWLVFGVGMLFLSLVFQNLGRAAPTVDGGVYGYAKDGFGDYVGFATSWGYWLSTWTGSVGYLVLVFASLGHYFPMFKGGNTLPSIIGASLILWLVHALILSGIKQATVVNTIVSVAKVVPIFVFLLLGIAAFKIGVFEADFWGQLLSLPQDDGTALTLGDAETQVLGMMMLLVWYFLGIESVSIYAARARKRRDAAKATLIGFCLVLFLLIAVNLLSFGITERAKLAGYADPSLSGVMKDAVGPWGEHFVIAGVIISVIGAYMSWMLLSSEILMYPGKDGLLPRIFGRENKTGVPTTGLWLTSICMQIMLLITLWNSATYTALTTLAGAMVLLPYLWTALYQIMIALQRRHDYVADATHDKQAGRDVVLGVVATIFAIFLLYAGGPQYLAFAGLWILLGTALYAWARKAHGKPFMKSLEWVVLLFVIIGAAIAIWMFATGQMTLLST